MSDLFFLNELDKQDVQKSSYTSDNNNLMSVNLFIKALKKVSDTIDEAVNTLSTIKKPNGTILERDTEDSILLVAFMEHTDLAGKILDEFQKGTSILHDNNTEELIQLFTELNSAFTIARIKLNLFSITKNIKYTEEIKGGISNILILFEQIKSVIIDTEKDTE